MSHSMTLEDRRIRSGELQNVDDIPPKMTDWWADFGVSERTAAPNPFQRVETSGLFFLQEVAEDLKQRPRPMAHVEAPKTPHLPMMPPPVLPSESALVAPRRSVWAVPGMVGAMVMVALLSILGTLWMTGRTGSRPTKGISAGASTELTPANSERGAQTRPAVAPAPRQDPLASAPGPVAPPPKMPAVVPPTMEPVADNAIAATNEESARDRKRRRKKRSRRSKDRDDEEEAPAPAAPGYSLYATLNAAGTASAPVRAETPKPLAVATEAAGAPPPAEKTYRMLKAAASGDERKPTARPSLPARLSSSAVTRALGKVRSPIQACLRRFGFGHATLRMRVTVNGATGRVSSARAVGRFQGTPVGRCALRRVHNLRFGRFARTSQTVLLPVRSN